MVYTFALALNLCLLINTIYYQAVQLRIVFLLVVFTC